MIPIEIIEKTIADQVRFLDIMLQEVRKHNKIVNSILVDSSYAKLIGLSTPYEECIHALREVRKGLNSYLSIIRDKMTKDEKSLAQGRHKKRRPPYRPPHNPS